jgi:hypothetical protein
MKYQDTLIKDLEATCDKSPVIKYYLIYIILLNMYIKPSVPMKSDISYILGQTQI